MAYRYRPRDYMVHPKSFGRDRQALWKPYDGVPQKERYKVAASYLQHLAACDTLTAARNKGWDLRELHQRIGTPGNLHTLRRKLYGEAPAAFDDIVDWAFAVGEVTVLPAPADLERALPPTAE